MVFLSISFGLDLIYCPFLRYLEWIWCKWSCIWHIFHGTFLEVLSFEMSMLSFETLKLAVIYCSHVSFRNSTNSMSFLLKIITQNFLAMTELSISLFTKSSEKRAIFCLLIGWMKDSKKIIEATNIISFRIDFGILFSSQTYF